MPVRSVGWPTLVALLMSCRPGCAAQSPVPAAPQYQFLEDAVAGEVDVRAQVAIPAPWEWNQMARVVLCYLDDADYVHLDISTQGLTLGKMVDGRPSVIAKVDKPAELADAGTHEFTVKRRAWGIEALCDGRAVLAAYDHYAPGDKIGTLGIGMQVAQVDAQPIGEMMFDDDFTRPPEEPGPWQALRGEWKTSLAETRDNKPEASKSANPFCYVGSGEKALAVVEGSAFWDSYRARVAVKPSGGAVGLAFYCQDKDNHYLLRANTVNTPEGGIGGTVGTVELVRVQGGDETVLSEQPVVVRSGRWYELSIRTSGGLMVGAIDGVDLCRASDRTFSQGNIGLYVDCPQPAYFDDARLEPYRWFVDEYNDTPSLPLETLSGRWDTRDGELRARVGAGEQHAIALTGCAQWSGYTFSSEVTAGDARAVGLYFGLAGPQQYCLFRWGGSRGDDGGERQELWRVCGESAELLDSAAAPLDRGRPHEVSVVTDRGYVAVSVDGRIALEGLDLGVGSPQLRSGRVGYHVEGAGRGATFDNLRVSFFEPPGEPPSITAQFEKEDTMADWARPGASWRKLDGNLHAYSLPVWGDFDLRIRPRRVAPAAAAWTVSVRVAESSTALANAESCISLSATAGQPGIVCGQTGATATSAEEDPLLEIERRGGMLLVSLDGVPFAGARVPPGREAPAIGLELTGSVTVADAVLTSPNIVDDAFSAAPTDWVPAAGTWTISDRWHCQPQWSWFCGRDAPSPLLWHKRPFSGDIVAEFWGAVMMDTRDGTGYTHPSDLNGVICGDGHRLCSGYAFVFAGENNTSTRLLRLGEVVAQTDAVKIGSKDQFHRHWFHCRLEKSGGHLTYSIDGEKALEYEDPDPLPGGYVGVWTYQGNGILVARTRIAYQEPFDGREQDE